MKAIIDVHSHILPGVDDGSRSWDESRWMLECAYRQGIRAIIATPHYSPRQETDRLMERAECLREEAHSLDKEFEIYLGQEILYYDSLTEDLKAGRALTMAGSRHVLVEFMPETAYGKIYQAVRKLLMSGYYPIAAHVERYRALRESGRMDELRGLGCLLQMNYRSLEGGLFDREARWCRRQVKDGKIDLLGTDAHRKDWRTPETGESLKWLEHHADRETVMKMTRLNALTIIGD